MMSGTDGTVQGDSGGNDEITDGTGGQLGDTDCRSLSLHGTSGFSPTETEGDLFVS
jgi:hypothetical protein